MQNEYQILNNIEKNKTATQRDIAKSTGMSLGNVNILIKRLVKKGLVKIERLNSRNIRYILTPQGIKQQASATYNYIVASYQFINGINSKIEALLKAPEFSGEKEIILFGKHDEVYQIIQGKFNENSIKYKNAFTIDNLNSILNDRNIDRVSNNDYIILTWHPDIMDALQSRGLKYINLLENL